MKRFLAALIVSASLIFVSVGTTVGCGSSTAITVEYRTLGSIVQARDLAMKSFASYYVSRKPPGAVDPDLESKSAQVGRADEKYRNAMIAFRGVVNVAYSDKTQAPPDVSAAADALINLINSFIGGAK